MPTNKEFTIRLEDRPGTLGKLCQALAEQSVNILAFQSCPLELASPEPQALDFLVEFLVFSAGVAQPNLAAP